MSESEMKELENEIQELFKAGFDCGQVVLAGHAKKLGLDIDQANRISACFGGGMFSGDTCGAVVAALMAIGLKYGHCRPDTPDTKYQCRTKVYEFKRKFLERYNSTICRELLTFDIGKPEEFEIILKKGLLFSFCPKVAAYAIEILSEILQEDGKQHKRPKNKSGEVRP